jgi:hypothetical protein
MHPMRSTSSRILSLELEGQWVAAEAGNPFHHIC